MARRVLASILAAVTLTLPTLAQAFFVRAETPYPFFNPATALGWTGMNTITFDELTFPNSTPVTTQYSELGASFEPNLYYVDNGLGGTLQNFVLNFEIRDPWDIVFSSPQTRAGFNVFSDGFFISTFQAYLGATLVETGFARPLGPSGGDGNFFGFEGVTFDRIRVAGSNTGPTFFSGIDNVTFSVPEPAGLSLVALALASMAWMRRRVRPVPHASPS